MEDEQSQRLLHAAVVTLLNFVYFPCVSRCFAFVFEKFACFHFIMIEIRI